MGSNDLLDSDELRGRIWRGTGARSARVALPTGFAALDRYLPGGRRPESGSHGSRRLSCRMRPHCSSEASRSTHCCSCTRAAKSVFGRSSKSFARARPAACWLGSRPPTTSRCGVCNWRQKLRVVGRFYSGRWPPVASGPQQLCVSVSSGKARSLEYESTNVAAHGPASSISERPRTEQLLTE